MKRIEGLFGLSVFVLGVAQLATGCGWGFGLSATEPNQAVFGDALVCAEGDE